MLLLLLSLSLASAQRLTDAEELAFKDNVEDLCRGRFVRKLIIGKKYNHEYKPFRHKDLVPRLKIVIP